MTHIVVDAMNVIGSRPDGWWRDRGAAARRLLVRLRAYAARDGVEVTLVLDGRSLPDLAPGMYGGVRAVFARDAGHATADDAIVALLTEEPVRPVEVFTSDRALQERVRALGAAVGSPRVLLARLDAADPDAGK